MWRALTTSWVVVLVLALAGCGSSGGSPEEADVGSTSPSTPTSPDGPSGPDPSEPGDPGSSESDQPTGPAAQAVADLAAELGIEADAVEVVSVEAVTWRDGSHGCAKRGFSYTQALVEGSRIILRAENAEHEYHAAGSRPPFRCDEPTQ